MAAAFILATVIFITAAHVIASGSAVTIKSDDGVSRKAEVLWGNGNYDIALLRVDQKADIAVAPLSCVASHDGQSVTAYGNPYDAQFVSTQGRLVGKISKIGPWPVALYVDMTILPGMSGGGVVDAYGDLVGISVGVMTAPEPAVVLPVPTGFGVVIPSTVICDLLARTI